MSLSNLLRLLTLAAIWGASFLFMRIAVPSLGPAWLMFARVTLAASFLAVVAIVLKRQLHLGQHGKHYLILGLINTALPFILFAYAAQHLTASILAILNATAPIWGAVIGILFFKQGLSLKLAIGLLLGVVGVAILVGFDPVLSHEGGGLAVIAALLAACCYGIATWYTKQSAAVPAFINAHGSMWGAALWLMPLLWFMPINQAPDVETLWAVLALGLVCTGIGYLLYFKLVGELGATSTLTVTFLIPVFGVIWGHLFLNEHLGWNTLFGASIVILGTALVTGFTPKAWRRPTLNTPVN